MRETEFRDWLNLRRHQGKALTTVNQRLNWCRAVERALPELGFEERDIDTVHAGGNWDALLSAVAKLRSNWRNNEAAARVIAPQSDNPSGQMANARSSIGMYGRFAGGDDPNYDEVASGAIENLTDAEILAHFTRKPGFAQWQAGWSHSDRAAFVRMVRTLHDAGLDWYHVNIDRQVRCGRKKAGAIDATEVFATISGVEPRCWVRKSEDRAVLGLPDNVVLLTDFNEAIEAAPEALARFAGGTAYWPSQVTPDPGTPVVEAPAGNSTAPGGTPTNLILYGPPGTGKTWRTAAEAVRLCDGLAADDPLLVHSARRTELKKRYDELFSQSRIGFVTFHQNFSYEDFVEGLRPPSGEEASSAGLRLDVHHGIFREMVTLALSAGRSTAAKPIDLAGRRFFKMSLGRAGVEDQIFDSAIDGRYLSLGWGGEEDWSDSSYDGEAGYRAIFDRWNEIEPGTSGNSGNISQVWCFRSSMRKGDLVVVSYGNSHVRAIGEVSGDYRFVPGDPFGYHHHRDVNWLRVFDEPIPASAVYDRALVQASCYRLQDALVRTDGLSSLLGADGGGGGEPLPYVLVIDEINRANISKVFGELITLIEPDKRLGGDNALRVKLPYSQDEFGIPANLHLVGTMNTADRSIALLDTALRRRFVFREIAPDPKRLPEQVGDVPLRRVLEVINDRIEYLIDREHRIGHAFFMNEGGKDRAAIDATMRDKVIPLLQEYFFEDWSRVAAVLGEPAETGGGFLDCRKLADPTGSDGEPRLSWSVRTKFASDAYSRLVGTPAPAPLDITE